MLLENLIIVDATMIVGILFVEAIGRSFKVAGNVGMAKWLMIWGYVALLPFAASSILALAGNEGAILAAGIGFVGFTGWFLFVTTYLAFSKEDTQLQYIADEDELEKWLEGGYVVVTVLKNGRVIVE